MAAAGANGVVSMIGVRPAAAIAARFVNCSCVMWLRLLNGYFPILAPEAPPQTLVFEARLASTDEKGRRSAEPQ